MKMLALIALFFGLCSTVVAQEARLLDISESRRTIVLNWGLVAGIRETDVVVFLQERSGGIEAHRVAKGEAVKVYENSSVWHLSDVLDDQALVSGNKLTLLKTQELVQGRRPLVIRRNRVVFSPKATPEERGIGAIEKVFPERMIASDVDYLETPVALPSTEDFESPDINVEDVSSWDEKGDEFTEATGDENKTVASGTVDKGFSEEVIQTAFTNQTADKMINENVANANDASMEPSRLAASVGGTKAFASRKQDEYKRLLTSKLKKKMASDGESWSDDLDDDELRDVLVSNGLALESRRQEFYNAPQVSHEFKFTYLYGLSDKTNSDDLENKGTSSNYLFAYEFHLATLSPIFEQFTSELQIEKGSDKVDGLLNHNADNQRGTNVEFSRSAFGIGVNYYFNGSPWRMDIFQGYVGSGIRLGSATATAETLSKDYAYRYQVIPDLHLGFKYCFKDEGGSWGWGLNTLLSFSRVGLTAGEVIEPSDDSFLDTEILYSDISLGLGVGIYF